VVCDVAETCMECLSKLWKLIGRPIKSLVMGWLGVYRSHPDCGHFYICTCFETKFGVARV